MAVRQKRFQHLRKRESATILKIHTFNPCIPGFVCPLQYGQTVGDLSAHAVESICWSLLVLQESYQIKDIVFFMRTMLEPCYLFIDPIHDLIPESFPLLDKVIAYVYPRTRSSHIWTHNFWISQLYSKLEVPSPYTSLYVALEGPKRTTEDVTNPGGDHPHQYLYHSVLLRLAKIIYISVTKNKDVLFDCNIRKSLHWCSQVPQSTPQIIRIASRFVL